ncbi:MAG TPA: GNAT family N-acetyltransferase, partial [Gammaproteobacteria bacterium]|nr:GNAT family N-acetyltransferase [Gammaproteobacteria bacterium]
QHVVEIRRAEPADYEALREVHAQPRVIWGTLQLPFPSAEVWRKLLAEQPDSHYTLCASIDGTVVGSLGLRMIDRSPRRRHAGEIGMVVHDAWQGRRIGTALLAAALELADRWLNLERLELTVYTDNEPAIRLYKKHGFEVEGRLRRYSFRDGDYADAFSMARLR